MGSIDYARLNVLVVDDQDMVRDIVVAILRAIGCTAIRIAAGGEQALDMVREEAPDLILCDISMEPIDGFQFVERLLAVGQRIPTIYLTAHSNGDFVRHAKRLGVDAYIVKPVKRSALEEKIRHVLEAG